MKEKPKSRDKSKTSYAQRRNKPIRRDSNKDNTKEIGIISEI